MGRPREGADSVDRAEEFFDVAESFQDEKIHAALFEGSGLLLEDGEDLLVGKFADVLDDSERADRAGDQDFVLGGFARFASDFHAAMIQLHGAVGHPKLAELVTVRAEGVGFDDLGAGFEVALVDVENGFGVEGIQLVHTALRADELVEQGAHGSVGDEDGVAEALVEVFDFHRAASLDFRMAINTEV